MPGTVPWFSCVCTAKTDEFQLDSKFVRFRVNEVFIADKAQRIEIINSTRGGIEDEIWERGDGGHIEIPDEHHTILGLHLKAEQFKTRVTKPGCFICFACHFHKHSPKILNQAII